MKISASAFCGAMSIGKTVADAAALAVDFTVQCISETLKDPDHPFYGVEFEKAFPYLLKRIG